MLSKPLVVCLMGPTATGKTDIAVELVQRFPCEIISVDSAMVYRGMDIGTAKPSLEIQKIAPHYLLDIRDPTDAYSAGDFLHDTKQLISKIIAKQKVPLLVGGTMLYFNVLQNGLANLPSANSAIRQVIAKKAEELGWPALHDELKTIDPIAAGRINTSDTQRIQRALEIYEITGKPLTQLLIESPQTNLPYSFLNLALIPQDRELLHRRIAQRFQKMLDQGFIAEVEALIKSDNLTPDLASMRAVGYRQVWEYLQGILSVNEMTERGIIATRQLAKRQLTWLRSWQDLHTFTSEDPQSLVKISQLFTQQLKL